MAPNTPPSYDRLDERSKSHADKLEALEKRCADMEKKLDSILSTLSEARGGWRMLLFIGGISGAAGAFLTKISAWLPSMIR